MTLDTVILHMSRSQLTSVPVIVRWEEVYYLVQGISQWLVVILFNGNAVLVRVTSETRSMSNRRLSLSTVHLIGFPRIVIT